MELWANSALGNIDDHSSGLFLVNNLRQVSSFWLTRSVSPSVWGWYAVDNARSYWRSHASSQVNAEANWGPWSKISKLPSSVPTPPLKPLPGSPIPVPAMTITLQSTWGVQTQSRWSRAWCHCPHCHNHSLPPSWNSSLALRPNLWHGSNSNHAQRMVQENWPVP